MKVMYKKELGVYFRSPLGWVFLAVSIAFMGIYFMGINLSSGYGNLAYTISSIAIIFLFTIPMLTMKSLAEERKSRTDQLLFTSPLSVGKIVLGKYLAMLTLLGGICSIQCFLPLLLSFYGTVAYGESYTAVLGYFLYGAACMAVGLFISGLTESQLIAAVLSLFTFFLTYMMEAICGLISSTGNLLTSLLGVFDFYGRFEDFLTGTLDLSAVLYFLTVIFLALYGTVQVIQKRRFTISRKIWSMGAYNGVFSLVVVAVAVLINLMVSELPATYRKLDVTKEKLYELTDTTKALLKDLDEDIQIYVLQAEESQDTVVEETLKRYAEGSSHIQVSYRDPAANPNFYQQYTTEDTSLNSLIVVSEKRHRVIDYYELYETGFDYSTYSTYATGYDGEGQLTSAIDYVTREEMPVAYTLTGHEESSLEQGFLDTIDKANLTLEELSLLKTEAVPEDAQFLLINVPRADLNSTEAGAILDYLEQGGKLMLVLPTGIDIQEEMPNLQSILDYFHTTVQAGIILEGDPNYYYQNPAYLLPEIETAAVTSDFYSGRYIFMPFAQGVTVEETDELYVATLLTATESAYLKQNLEEITTYEKQEEDLEGPFTTAVLVEKTLTEELNEADGEETMETEETVALNSRLYLFASEAIFTESADSMVSGTNSLLFANTIQDMVDEQESSVTVPVKTYEENGVIVSQAMVLLWGAVVVVILPLMLLIAGLFIWLRRRKL
ncbi:MAG: Gldg family protein [Lachnospiraceae bacterium]|nr:Gldg family protein [Lachnospiraceae bacterium]